MSTGTATGTTVDGFRIESLIGEGAMGAVYRADAPSGQRVAVKLLSPELARDERFRQRFLRESQLAASLYHPHIVPTLASGEEDGTLYLAMAYVEGSDLRALLRSEDRLEPQRAVDLIGQVAEALDAAHAAGLVHRDVKPGNILVAAGPEGEQAYVCDFGLARHVTSVSSLTGERGFVGTIDYVPPEQIEGGQIDGRADVYSLGCVLFECLTAERPFERDSELAVVFGHLNDRPPRLTELRPELPEAFDSVFQTALAKSPDDRYQTCGELSNAARAALHGRTFVRRKLRRRRLALAAAALLGIAGAAIGVLAEEGGSARHGMPVINETSIAGAKLGETTREYKKLFGVFRPSTLTEFASGHFKSLAFQRPEVAIYFPPGGKRAAYVTTWNRAYRTAAGVGPCSTIGEMKKAYGKDVHPSVNGTHGKTVWSWVVNDRLLFATHDHKTIADVVLYRGSPTGDRHQGWANYIGAVETACE
jgi:tRNA A-37 threonylcarbamoyl transferase component Bud32